MVIGEFPGQSVERECDLAVCGVQIAEVAFVARSRDATGRASRLVEHSRFVREGGRWYYVDGRLGG